MRKEFLGPLPLAIGLLIIAGALLSPARAPPAPQCACAVMTASEFEAIDAAGYPNTAPGATLVVDGRVISVQPSPLVSAPYRIVQFEGSAIRFNVSAYNAATGPVGEWVRISTTHNGANETAGPETGHRWTHEGKTAPPGQSVVSLAGLAVGIAIAGWGAATMREFSRTRARAKSLTDRVGKARQDRAADPAASQARALGKELEDAAAMVRRGQYDSAETALKGVEAQMERATRLGEALRAAQAELYAETKAGFHGAAVAALLEQASAERASGRVPEAEKLLERALVMTSNLRPLRELLAATDASLASSAAQGIEDIEAPELLSRAKEQFAAGAVDEALPLAERAFRRARQISPGAQKAAGEIDRLKEFLRLRPEFDRSREVRDRVRDADELYHLGQFDRALAEAQVGLWLADSNALSASEFEEIAKRRFSSQGFAIDPPGSRRPPLGFLAVAKESVVVVTSAWRDFPSERVMFALKDFMAEGGAGRAVVYSSAFTNTSTDPRIEVVDASQLVEVLREAALQQVAGSAKG